MSIHLDKGKPRTLAYAAHLRSDLKLLEVTEELLAELQEKGLTFKGRAQDEAVLCSSTQTFVVKKVETSNLVMLIDSRTEPPPPSPTAEAPTPGASAPPGNIPGLSTQLNSDASAAQQPQVTVSALIGSHLELVHTAPRLRALDAVLADRPFGADEPMGGPENPDGSNPPGRTWEELLEEVQASPAELAAALEGRNALRVEGRWRGVDPGYLGTVLELVLLTAIEKGWSLDAVPAADAADALVESGFAPEVTHLCLRKFGTPASTGTADSQAMDGSAVGATASGGDMAAAAYSPDGEPLQLPLEGAVQLQESAVCRYFGVSLLSDRPRWESVEEFMTAWSAAVPEGMTPALEVLRGQVLLDTSGGTTGGLRYFPVDSLPGDAAGRFAALFSAKPHWELPDLEPYLEGLDGPGETQETLLLKFARASQKLPTDPVTYSAR